MASIDELGLSDRIVSNLLEAGLTESSQLADKTRDDLIALPGIGEASADEILAALTERDAVETINELAQDALRFSNRETLLIEACQWAIDVWRAMPGQQPMFLASQMQAKIDAALSEQ
ncbi:MAG: DNA-directed RNA polymerase subunit alpha C-terminal domain-containing protein [Cyanobacteria bacterium P01_A01_bin.17]